LLLSPATQEKIVAAAKAHPYAIATVAFFCLGVGFTVGVNFDKFTDERSKTQAATIADLETRNTELKGQVESWQRQSQVESAQRTATVDQLSEKLQQLNDQHLKDVSEISRLNAVNVERDKLRAEGEKLAEQPNTPPKTNVKSTQEDAQRLTPGWIVRLRTGSIKDGHFEFDPGFVAAYREEGPLFSESTFLREARLEGATDPVFGLASAKFNAASDGAYQFGIRIEPAGAICGFSLTVNGKEIARRRANGHGPTIVISPPIPLQKGYNDIVLDVGCYNGLLGRDAIVRSDKGALVVLIQRPGDLAAAPAQPGDFVSPP